MEEADEDKVRFTITPKLTKSMYDEETWSNTLKNGKKIYITIVSYWRWGEFGIDLSPSEYDEVSNSNTIVVSDYDYEFYSSHDCKRRDIIIENKNNFNKDELEEINNIFEAENLEDFLCENGWISGDVTYTITDGCDLEEED